MRQANSSNERRQKISQALKLKWQDEAFRARMRSRRLPFSDERRRRLSEAIARLWHGNAAYREKTLSGIRRHLSSRTTRESRQSYKDSLFQNSLTGGGRLWSSMYTRLVAQHQQRQEQVQ
ncbi:hypothetical protein cyc_02666 [Cyclospora cayetanensis]|uniref:Uncharacterized protein n=1 Tax=Cyclospora cayetanensis TaxID=88456 RepID=A0A1D3DA65_9EIME|nr:hypothetical protein cyc_02666 [Cyclospora cayetanensis]